MHESGVLTNTTTQHQRYLIVQKLFSNVLHKLPSEQMTEQVEELKQSVEACFEPEESNIKQLFHDYVEEMKEMKIFEPILELENASELALVLRPIHSYIPMKVFTALLLKFPGARFDFWANEVNVSNNQRLDTYLCLIKNEVVYPLMLCEDKAHAYSTEDYEKLKETARSDMKNGILELCKRSQNINSAKYEIILMQTVGSNFYLSSFHKNVIRKGNRLQTLKNSIDTITLDYSKHSNKFSMKNIFHVFDAIAKCLDVLFDTVEFLMQQLESKPKFNNTSFPKTPTKVTNAPKSFLVGRNKYKHEFILQEDVSCYRSNGIEYIVKYIDAYEKRMIEIVRHCGSPHTVPGIFAKIESNEVFITKRYLKLETDFDFYRIVNITQQMVEGVGIYHQNGIIHSDIKPPNIVIDDNDHIYFIDFGISQVFDTLDGEVAFYKGKPIQKQAGTPNFVAPECKTQRYGPKIDLYGIGVTLLCMLSDIETFDDDTEIYITDIAKFVHDFEKARPFETLLTHLLKQDPKERWGVLESLLELERIKPFVKQTASDIQNSLAQQLFNSDAVDTNFDIMEDK